MKYELHMRCGLVQLPNEILPVGTAIGTNKTVKFLPHHQCSVPIQSLEPTDTLRIVGNLDHPPVTRGYCVQVPDRARYRAVLSSYDGESPALRERCCFQAEPEPSEIGIRAAIEGTRGARAHRLDQFVSRHSDTVVQHADCRNFVMSVGEQMDISGSCGDRVVDDVCEGCLEGITHVAEALDQRRGARWKLKFESLATSCHGPPMGCRDAQTVPVASIGLAAFGIRLEVVAQVRS